MYEEEFTLDETVCHLNHAAVSPWPRRTVEIVRRFAEENSRIGSRDYEKWLQTEQALREQLRQLINAQHTDEIALLKNTSEALSVVAYGMPWCAGDEVIITNQEFPSNRIVWESLEPLDVKVIEVDITRGDSPESAIIDGLSPRTRLVSVSSVQYGTGLALDLNLIGNACHTHDVAFCVDAIQSLGAKPFDAQSCRADFVVADGHKWMLGPEGLALFYCRRDWIPRLSLKQYGWHMVEALGDYARRDWQPAASARRFECGSPNMLGIHALHASLSLLLELGIPHGFHLISRNIQYLIDYIDNTNATILSPTDPARRAGIITFKPADDDIEARYRHLQQHGVICALRGGGIRFSPHFYTALPMLDRALNIAFEPLRPM